MDRKFWDRVKKSCLVVIIILLAHWRVESTPKEVFAILSDPFGLVRWWPAVYLEVREVKTNDESGLGRVVDLCTTGWLPYIIRWQLRTVERVEPTRLVIEANGDFTGRGIWTLEQDGAWVDIFYDWQIQANKPLLRYLSPVLRPLFSANHHWAMAKGEESLKLEIARRRAKNAAERAQIPPPPPPTLTGATSAPFLLIGTLILIIAIYKTFKKSTRDY